VLDLKAEFGHRYRVELDESYRNERPEWRGPIAEYQRIPAKFGFFFPHESGQVAFWCKSNRIKVKLLAALGDKVSLHREADTETIFLFDKEHFGAVAGFAQPRKRRCVSEATRQRLAEQGSKTRFSTALRPTSRPRTARTTPRQGRAWADRAKGKSTS